MTQKPFIKSLNNLVHSACVSVLPYGFTLTHDGTLCDTLEKITNYYKQNETCLVWQGASDHTVFDNPFINHAFRAWHDFIHIRYQFQFTLHGEREAFLIHKQHVDSLIIEKDLRHLINRILYVEVCGQAQHFETFKEFLQDQKAFTLSRL